MILSYVELGENTYENNSSLLIGNDITLSGWFKSRKFNHGLRALDFGNYDDGKETDLIILSSSGLGADANFSVSNGSEISSLIIPDFWKLHQWQHVAITIQDDGLTSFYSNGELQGSGMGKTPPVIKRSHHIIGGNRLWMETFDPKDVSGLKLWLDANDTYSMDKGTSVGSIGPPSIDGDNVRFWGDKSGNGYHATTSNSPTYRTNSINGMPSVDTDGDWFNITDSATEFDQLDSMTFMLVWKWNSQSYWTAGIRKHNSGNGNNQLTGFSFDRQNIGANQSTGLWWGTGTNKGRLTGVGSMNAYDDPKLITVRYDGSNTQLTYYANGNKVKEITSGIVTSFVSNSHPLSIGNKYNYGEFLFYRDPLSDGDREFVEGYLAHKWGIAEDLPISHSFFETSPTTPQQGFEFFDGLVDDLRIYDRALTSKEIGLIHAGDLSEYQNLGGDDPVITLYWGDEDGGSNSTAWDNHVVLGKKNIGEFDQDVTGLEAGHNYYYRLRAENIAGENWTSEAGTFSSANSGLHPMSIPESEIVLWLDSSDINGDEDYTNEPYGGKVDQWRDKSGGNRHAQNGNGPDLMYNSLNEKSTLRFNGSSHFLRISDYGDSEQRDLDIGNEATLFLLISSPGITANTTLLSKGWNDSEGWIFKAAENSALSWGLRGTSGIDETISNLLWSDQFKLLTLHKDETADFVESMVSWGMTFWIKEM